MKNVFTKYWYPFIYIGGIVSMSWLFINLAPASTPITIPDNVEQSAYTDYLLHLPAPGREYLKEFAPVAVRFGEIYDLAPSIILAIAMHESDFGRSELAKNGLNHFGMSCMTDSCILLTDHGSKKSFQQYVSPIESYEHFCQQFNTDRYRDCRVFNNAWDLQARAIQMAGYAQDTKWHEKVSSLVVKYRLWYLDQIVEGNQINSITL